MKKQILAAILATSGITAVHAETVPSVDISREVFISHIQGTWKPAAASVSNDKPDITRSTNQFVHYIQSGGQRHAEAVSNDKPDVDRSIALFANSILN